MKKIAIFRSEEIVQPFLVPITRSELSISHVVVQCR